MSRPITSLGTAFDPAAPRMWGCSDCGQSGYDRDDVQFPECKAPGSRGVHGAGFHFIEPNGTILTLAEHREKKATLEKASDAQERLKAALLGRTP